VTHNRVDFERLHLQFTKEERQYFGIIFVPQKNAYEVVRRVCILVNKLTGDAVKNQLLYA